MKQEPKNLDTPKNIEQRITDALAADDATSDTLGALIAEVETEVCQTTKAVEMDRALDINTDIAVEHRTITQNELARSRWRVALADLQQKFVAARQREEAADWQREYERVEKIRNDAAEQYAEIPKLMDRLIELFQLDEAVTKQCSAVNGNAPANEHRRRYWSTITGEGDSKLLSKRTFDK